MTEEEFAAANYSPKNPSAEKCCKVLTQTPHTCEVAGEAFVLVPVEDYIPYECVNAELAEKDKRIRQLEQELAETQKVDAVVNGELYWPMSLLPKEISLLADGQFVSLKCSARVRGDKVVVQEVELGR
jgi:hypothetical protein